MITFNKKNSYRRIVFTVVFVAISGNLSGKVMAGDVLGEISLVSGSPHSATARVSKDTQCIIVAHEDFETLTKKYPRIGLTIMQNIAHSLGDKLLQADITIAHL